MDIRGNAKEIKKLKDIKTQLVDVNFNVDEKVEVPIMMIQNNEGKLIEYLRGYTEIATFIKYGYNRITKNCPYRQGTCIAEKCSLYFIENGTGDCAHIWALFKGNK